MSTEWIVPCNPNKYFIDDAFLELGNVEWQIGRCGIKKEDIIYIYIGHTDHAIRYKCIAVSDKREITTIDDYWYGGNPVGVGPYPCIEIKPIGYYSGEGIRYKDLQAHGLKGSIQGPIRALGEFGDYIRSIKEDDFLQKVSADVEKESERLFANISDTLKEVDGYDVKSVVKSRRNQGVFRSLILKKYNKKCCLCGLDNPYLLIASHIKPWADCSSKEKVSINNGLLLCPNHDKLFDEGFISFNEDGSILVSKDLTDKDCELMNVNRDIIIQITEEQKLFFKYHREHIFI